MSTNLPDNGRVQFDDLAPNERFRIQPGGSVFQRVGNTDVYVKVGQATHYRWSNLDIGVIPVDAAKGVAR